MTDKEKAVVMAYTGIAMLTGDKFEIFHKYVEEIMSRPVFTHEFATCAEVIKEKAKFDFLALCAEEEKRPDATFKLYRDDMFSGGCYLQCTSCKWKFSGGAYKILEHDNYCPHCGAKIKRPEPDGITLTFNVDKIEKFEDASCENCEHACRGADPLKIIQDSKYLFYCAAGHAYGGSETVCSEWKRKEGDEK